MHMRVAAWLRPRQQAIVHLILLAVSLACLPITPSAELETYRDRGSHLANLGPVGRPRSGYRISLSHRPRRWCKVGSAAREPGRSPYRLYALSNAGSLLALLSYPFVVEPAWSLATQTWAWSLAYVGFVALCGWCALSFDDARRN